MNPRNTLQLIGRINEISYHKINGKQITTLDLLVNEIVGEEYQINEFSLICRNDKAKILTDICKKGNEIFVSAKLIKHNQVIQIELIDFIFFK